MHKYFLSDEQLQVRDAVFEQERVCLLCPCRRWLRALHKLLVAQVKAPVGVGQPVPVQLSHGGPDLRCIF